MLLIVLPVLVVDVVVVAVIVTLVIVGTSVISADNLKSTFFLDAKRPRGVLLYLPSLFAYSITELSSSSGKYPSIGKN